MVRSQILPCSTVMASQTAVFFFSCGDLMRLSIFTWHLTFNMGLSRGAQSVTISAVFTALAVIIVLLRLWTRFFIVRNAGLEDYFIVVSIVSSTYAPIRGLCQLTSLKLNAFGFLLTIGLRTIKSATEIIQHYPLTWVSLEVKYGMGKHIWEVSQEEGITSLKVRYLGSPSLRSFANYVLLSRHSMLVLLSTTSL